jgi:hypothetical protein
MIWKESTKNTFHNLHFVTDWRDETWDDQNDDGRIKFYLGIDRRSPQWLPLHQFHVIIKY